MRHHADIDVALLFVAAGVVYALVLGYDAPYLFGTKEKAALAGAVLAVLMTFPFYLYLIGKYLGRGIRHLTHA